MPPYTVNQVLDHIADLDAHPVEVEGILELESEGYALLHFPKSERKCYFREVDDIYMLGIWLASSNGSLQVNHTALQRWLGKRVRVHGILHTLDSLPDCGFSERGGFGPYGIWPVEIEPYSIQRLGAKQRRSSDT